MRTATRLRILSACAIVAACACGPAAAQNVSTDALPKALKDVPKAIGTCRPDRVEPVPARRTARKPLLPDLSCAVSPTELAAGGKHPATFIDTRPAAEYGQFHIDGTLQLSASALRSKSYLRGKNLVLVGDGKAERELYIACAELKRDGFKHVRVLRGGMPGWVAQGQPVLGRAPAPERMIRLSAAELWMESQFDRNLVLLADDQLKMLPDLPYAAALGHPSVENIKAAVRQLSERQAKKGPFAAVVLVTDGELAPGQAARVQQALKPVPVLVYGDTRQALNRYVATQKAMWAAQARGPKQPDCGT